MLLIKNSAVYDQLKYLTQIVLPAFGTLYFALSQIWGLPNGEQVVGTIVAIDAFLGVSLGISTAAYNKSDDKYSGNIVVHETDGVKQFSLNLHGDPLQLENQEEVLFKVDMKTVKGS